MGFVQGNHQNSVTLGNLRFCFRPPPRSGGPPPNEAVRSSSGNDSQPVDAEIPDLDTSNITDKSQCSDAFKRFKLKYSYMPERLDQQCLSGVLAYDSEVKALFVNATFDYVASDDYKTCMEHIDNLIGTIHADTNIYQQAERVATASDGNGALIHAEGLLHRWKEKVAVIEAVIEDHQNALEENCDWIKHEGRGTEGMLHMAAKDLMDAKDFGDAARAKLEKLAKNHQNLMDAFTGEVNTVIKSANLYLNKSISKAELAGKFSRSLFNMDVERISDSGEKGRLLAASKHFSEFQRLKCDETKREKTFVPCATFFSDDGISSIPADFEYLMKSYESSIDKAFEKLRFTHIPVVNDYNLHDLTFIKAANEFDGLKVETMDDMKTMVRALNPLASTVKVHTKPCSLENNLLRPDRKNRKHSGALDTPSCRQEFFFREMQIFHRFGKFLRG